MPHSPADARPTTNHAPPRTLIHPPSVAVARFRDISSNRPPTAVATPGNTCSQPRASVHVHAASGVDAKSKNVPTNGISAPHTPSTISRKPLIAPRLRGIPNRPPRVRIRVSVFMAQRIPPINAGVTRRLTSLAWRYTARWRRHGLMAEAWERWSCRCANLCAAVVDADAPPPLRCARAGRERVSRSGDVRHARSARSRGDGCDRGHCAPARSRRCRRRR